MKRILCWRCGEIKAFFRFWRRVMYRRGGGCYIRTKLCNDCAQCIGGKAIEKFEKENRPA